MTISLLASACPAVQVPVTASYKTTAHSAGAGATLLTSYTIPETSNAIVGAINGNAAAAEMLSRYGAGGYGIGTGLALSTGVGLNVRVGLGQAVLDGLIEIAATPTSPPAAPDNTALTYIWLGRSGVIYAQATTAAPVEPAVYLGAITTLAGDITAVDTSGVCYWRGGILYRETADLGQPSDTPSASVVLLTRTVGGLWLWDGAEWALLPDGLACQVSSVVSGATVRVPAGHQAQAWGDFAVIGSLMVFGEFRVTA